MHFKIKYLHTLIFLVFCAPAYAWQCADDTRMAFAKAKAAYVIRIESKTKLESSTKLDEEKFLVKYEVIENLKGKSENKKGGVIDTIGFIPNYVDFEIEYYYILFLNKVSAKGSYQYVNGCNVHAKAKGLEDDYFIRVLSEIR